MYRDGVDGFLVSFDDFEKLPSASGLPDGELAILAAGEEVGGGVVRLLLFLLLGVVVVVVGGEEG